MASPFVFCYIFFSLWEQLQEVVTPSCLTAHLSLPNIPLFFIIYSL
jgi:hypothetical protein